MNDKRIPVPKTERLERLANAWAKSTKPAAIVTPGPGQESVWDYPRPPAIERVSVRAQVFVGDVCIADSRDCLRVLETASPPTVYIPARDVVSDCLEPDSGSSFCEWKGQAVYFRVTAAGRRIPQAAWSYPEPLSEYEPLAGYLSFYPGRVTRCLYGDEIVKPQPGRFYGGWITSNLVGPFKGDPGSGGW